MQFKKLLLASALSSLAIGAHADTLMVQYAGTINWTVDATHDTDLANTVNGVIASDAAFSNFDGYIVVDNYENYMTGTHTLNFADADSPVKLGLFSPMLRGIEGANSNPGVLNSAYVPGIPNCTSRSGCDFYDANGNLVDGVNFIADGVIDTSRNNNPMFLGSGTYAVTPDNSQLGEGSITIMNGRIVDLTYMSYATAGSLVKNTDPAWAPATSSNAADSINNFLARGGWQTRVKSIDMTVDAFNTNTLVGGEAGIDGMYLSTGRLGAAEVVMTAAVPEPETYAMMLAGLGLVGLIARRRKSNNALVA